MTGGQILKRNEKVMLFFLVLIQENLIGQSASYNFLFQVLKQFLINVMFLLLRVGPFNDLDLQVIHVICDKEKVIDISIANNFIIVSRREFL